MATRQQIIDALTQAMPDVDGDAIEQTPSGRITGFIVSGQFDGLDYFERQAMIRRALENHFTKDQRRNIGPIAALNTYEAEIHTAESQ